MNFQKIFKHYRLFPCISLLLSLLYLSFTNLHLIPELAKEHSLSDAYGFADEMESHISSNFAQKYGFYDLNGLMSRVLGINDLNGIQRLKDGYLVYYKHYPSSTEVADNMERLSQLAQEEGFGFLCAPIPRKEEFYDARPAAGYQSSNPYMRQFMDQLRQRGINSIDMDTWFRDNGWTMEDTYFVADHHWRPEAAFAAVKEVMAFYSQNYDVIYNPETLDPANWNVEIYEDWMLGSYGRSTGILYTELDDLTYIYPKFETDMEVRRINVGKNLFLRQEDTLYDTWYLDGPTTYDVSPYCLYMGGDYPLIYCKNELAVNDKTLIVVGDSFRLPAECFLATQFTQIYHIDLRHYEDGTFVEFVRQIQPDLVLAMFDSCTMNDKHDYRFDQWDAAFAGKSPSDPVLQEDTITLAETRSKDNYKVLRTDLVPGAYVLDVNQTVLQRNTEINHRSHGGFVQFSLLDLKTGEPSATRYFLANEAEPQKWLFTVPENPDASYAIVIYNGTSKYTDGNSASIHGLTLAQYQ